MVNVQKAIVVVSNVFGAAKIWFSAKLLSLKAWLGLDKSATNDQVVDAVADKAKQAVDAKIDQVADTVKTVVDTAQTVQTVLGVAEAVAPVSEAEVSK